MKVENKIPSKSSQTASRIIDGEAVIVLLKKSRVHVLNEVGSRIWELSNGKRSIKKIADTIFKEFKVTKKKALKDTTEFVKSLTKKKMLTLKD